MFSLFSRKHLEKSLGTLQSRFPVPAMISIILTLYVCYQIFIDQSGTSREATIFTTITSLVLTFFLSVGATLWTEGEKGGKWKHLIQILPILYGVIYYFSFSYNQSLTGESIAFFLLHLAGFVGFIFFTPFLARVMRGREYSIEYSNYFSRVSWTILMSMIVGGSLVVLGFIAIGSIDKLFDIGYSGDYEKLYGYWAAVALALIAPMYGLSQFPRSDAIESKTYENNRFFAFVVKYISVPFVLIYFAILYVYSIKVLMYFGEWPKGMIAWLVIGFSSLGYLTYIYSKPYEQETEYIKMFRKYFPYAVIPQILMLAYAIYLRIAQYGYTMNRYFVVAFGIWLTIISLYFVLSKRKILIAIPLFLSVISLIISVGPWSVFSYPKQDQQHRLIANLHEANILQNGKIVPLTDKKSISKELSNEIYTQIEYLCNQDDCEYIKSIFTQEIASITQEEKENWERWNQKAPYTGPYSYQIINGVTRKIGVERYYPSSENYESKYISHYIITGPEGLYPMDIVGYDTVVSILQAYGPKGDTSTINYPYLTFDSDTSTLRYYVSSGAYQSFPLDLHESMRQDVSMQTQGMNQHDKKDMTYTVGNTAMEIKVVFQSLSVKNPKYTGEDTWNTGGASGVGLIKYKK